MKAVKIGLSIIGVLVLIVAIALWYLLSNLNSIVQGVVEDVGSETLQTPVTLGRVDIKLMDGAGELGDFSIKNYPGFSAPTLAQFDTVRLDIDPGSVRNDVVVIDELTISGVAITAEQKGTTTNLQTLLSKLPKSETQEEAPVQESAAPEILLAVKKLNFIDNSVNFVTENYGSRSLNLPKIERSNLGSADAGLTPEQLAREIARPLVEAAKKRVENELTALAKEELEARYGEEIDKKKAELESQLEDQLGEDPEKKLKDLKKLF